MTKQEQLRYEYFIATGIVWIDTNDNIEMDYLKWVENKALTIPIVSKSVNCDDCNGEGERWSAYYSSYVKCDCKV
jgi:hypothetical protein